MRKLLVVAIALVLFPLAGWTQTNPSRPLKVALLVDQYDPAVHDARHLGRADIRDVGCMMTGKSP